MRSTWLLACLLLAAPLAGCLGDDGADPQASAQPSEIHDERSLDVAADLQGQVRAEPCQAETARCFVYTFDAPAATPVNAELVWTNPANDLDLYLYPYAEDQASAQAASPGPSTSETLDTDLEPGTYRLVVVANLAAQDTYNLDVVFPAS